MRTSTDADAKLSEEGMFDLTKEPSWAQLFICCGDEFLSKSWVSACCTLAAVPPGLILCFGNP